MPQKKKFVTKATPPVKWKYAFVQRTQKKYESEEEQYAVTAIFDKNDPWLKKQAAAWKKEATEQHKAAIAEEDDKVKQKKLRAYQYNSPIKPVYDPDTGDETDEVSVTFKLDAEWKSKRTGKSGKNTVRVVDAKRNTVKTDLNIGDDTVGRISFNDQRLYQVGSAKFYGLSLKLVAVQVLELVEYQGGPSNESLGFDEESDGFTYDEDAAQFDDPEEGDADEDLGGDETEGEDINGSDL